MKNIYKKLILVLLGSMCLLSVSFGIIINNNNLNEYYNSSNININLNSTTNYISYPFNDTYIYLTMDNINSTSTNINEIVNNYDFTNNGASIGYTGIINEGLDFDGSNDDIYRSFNNLLEYSDSWTISMWVNFDSVGAFESTLIKNGDGGSYRWFFGFDGYSTNSLGFQYYDGSWGYYMIDWNYVNEWKHVVVTNSNRNFHIYVDGVEISSNGNTNGPGSADDSGLYIGSSSNEDYFNGQMDEVAIWTRVLDSTEISDLYDAQKNKFLQFPFQQEPTLLNTNMSYILDNQSKILICSNCNSTTLELTNLSEGSHSILFESADGNGVINTAANFTIDTIKPTINLNNITEVNSYEVNLSNLFNYSDYNLDSCYTIIENNINNCSKYLFSISGNQTIQVYVNDSAGNINNQNITILINPYQYFYFKLSNGTYVTDYEFGSINWNKEAKFKIYNDKLSIGNNSLIFKKLGYKTANITIYVNSSSNINKTYEVSLAKLIIKIYDKVTNNIIKGTNFTLNFIGDLGFVDYINTGEKNISKIIFNNQDYQLITSGNGFKTESKFFKYDNYDDLNINIYMLNETNAGFVYVKVVDNFGEIKKNVLVQTLQWDSNKGAYILVGESKTDDNGFVTLNIVLDSKLYKFRAIENENSIESTSQIISTNDNGKVIVLTITDKIISTDFFLNDIIYNISENYNNITNTSKISFSWINQKGNDIVGCINIYQFYNNGNEKLIDSNCSFPSSSSTLIRSYYINSSSNIKIVAGIKENDKFIKLKSYIHYSNFQINKFIDDFGLSFLVLPLLFIISIILGISLNVTFGAIGVIISSGIGLYLVPQFINKSIVAFIMFIGIALIVGGNKRK